MKKLKALEFAVKELLGHRPPLSLRCETCEKDLRLALALPDDTPADRYAEGLEAAARIAERGDDSLDIAAAIRALAAPPAAPAPARCEKCGGDKRDANHAGNDPDWFNEAPACQNCGGKGGRSTGMGWNKCSKCHGTGRAPDAGSASPCSHSHLNAALMQCLDCGATWRTEVARTGTGRAPGPPQGGDR